MSQRRRRADRRVLSSIRFVFVVRNARRRERNPWVFVFARCPRHGRKRTRDVGAALRCSANTHPSRWTSLRWMRGASDYHHSLLTAPAVLKTQVSCGESQCFKGTRPRCNITLEQSLVSPGTRWYTESTFATTCLLSTARLVSRSICSI
jgi:hypothetical protein